MFFLHFSYSKAGSSLEQILSYRLWSPPGLGCKSSASASKGPQVSKQSFLGLWLLTYKMGMRTLPALKMMLEINEQS